MCGCSQCDVTPAIHQGSDYRDAPDFLAQKYDIVELANWKGAHGICHTFHNCIILNITLTVSGYT
jgi:hypothetical protein